MRLQDSYDLRVNWCFLEIHPETDAAGEAISSLDYPPAQWQQLMHNLGILAAEENLPINEPDFITNSKDALLLAEAARHTDRKTFYRLHHDLFEAYFVAGRNIGDREVLQQVAAACGLDAAFVDAAFDNEQNRHRLAHNLSLARELHIQSVPAFVFGQRVLTGVVSETRMREAARESLADNS